jgi:hypothetical protein
MGWKSTQTLTRADAERRFVEYYIETKAAKRRERGEERMRDVTYVSLPYSSRRRDLSDLDLDTQDKFEIFHAVDVAMRSEKWTRDAKHLMVDMDDAKLADELETLAEQCGSTYNYYITEHPDDL